VGSGLHTGADTQDDSNAQLKSKVKFLEDRISDLESTVKHLMQYKHLYEKEKSKPEININSNIYGKVYFNQYINNGEKGYNHILFHDEVAQRDTSLDLNNIVDRTKHVLNAYYTTIINK
jgi:hypothetical protein